MNNSQMDNSQMNNQMNMNMEFQNDSSNMDAPWYLRTLPGRTGDFMGHAIPGVCFAGLGMFLLLVALYRARRLPPHKSFVEMHVPENDPFFLLWFGRMNLVGTTVGMLYEILDKDPGFDAVALTHCTLYASYFIMGLCAIYESRGKLPVDTHRAAFVLACIVQAIIWYAHGTMKQLAADAALHIYLSYLNWIHAAVVAYSMRYTDSLIAFLTGWALLVLQGIWIFISGLYECCIDLQMHDVAGLLAILTLLIFLSIVLVFVHYGPALSDQDTAHYRGKFTALDTQEDDDHDTDNEHNNGIHTI